MQQTLVTASPGSSTGPLAPSWRRTWAVPASPAGPGPGVVTAVGCAAGADLIAVGVSGGCLRLHRRSGELVAERQSERTSDLMELAFGEQVGRPYLVSIDRGNVLQLWDGVTGAPLTTVSMTGRRGSRLSLLTIGGRLIVSLTGDRWRGVLIDLASGRKTAKDEFDGPPVTYLDGHPVTVTAHPSGDLQVTEAPPAGSGAVRPAEDESEPTGPVVCFHAGGRLLAAVADTHEVTVWDVAEHRIVDVLAASAPVAGLTATATGDLVIQAGGEAVFLARQPPATGPQPDPAP